jgi:Coenzyme PQQ synthesis protein D (PqqD)
MLSASDCGRLPGGVRPRGAELVDEVRGWALPMNPAAAFVVDRAGAPLGAIVEELAVAYGLPYARARADVLAFVLSLNRQLLLNVEHRVGRIRRSYAYVSLALRLAPAGMLPGTLARRAPLDTRTRRAAVQTALLAVAPRASLLASVVALFALQLALVAGAWALPAAASVGVGAGVGFALHEVGHAVALCGVPAALVLRGRRTFVLHGPLASSRRRAVAVAGPASVAAFGGMLVFAAAVTTTPLLAFVGLAPTAHAVSLTVATGDGRRACGL